MSRPARLCSPPPRAASGTREPPRREERGQREERGEHGERAGSAGSGTRLRSHPAAAASSSGCCSQGAWCSSRADACGLVSESWFPPLSVCYPLRLLSASLRLLSASLLPISVLGPLPAPSPVLLFFPCFPILLLAPHRLDDPLIRLLLLPRPFPSSPVPWPGAPGPSARNFAHLPRGGAGARAAAPGNFCTRAPGCGFYLACSRTLLSLPWSPSLPSPSLGRHSLQPQHFFDVQVHPGWEVCRRLSEALGWGVGGGVTVPQWETHLGAHYARRGSLHPAV